MHYVQGQLQKFLQLFLAFEFSPPPPSDFCCHPPACFGLLDFSFWFAFKSQFSWGDIASACPHTVSIARSAASSLTVCCSPLNTSPVSSMRAATPLLGFRKLSYVTGLCCVCVLLCLAVGTQFGPPEATVLEFDAHGNTDDTTPPVEHDIGDHGKHDRRGFLGPNGIMPGKVLPGILSALGPNLAGLVTSVAAAPLSNVVPAVPNLSNALPTVPPDGGAGLTLLPNVAPLPLPDLGHFATVADDAADWMGAGISGLLRGQTGLVPAGTPLPSLVAGLVADAKSAAGVLLDQVQDAAADIVNLANQVESDVLHPDDALADAGHMLNNLESQVESMVNSIVTDLGNLPTGVLNEVKGLIGGGLSSIILAPQGPAYLFGDMLADGLCAGVKEVDGILQTVTGICDDMASITSSGADVATTPPASTSDSQTSNPGQVSTPASAAQSVAPSSATSTGAGQTTQPSATGSQGGAPGISTSGSAFTTQSTSNPAQSTYSASQPSSSQPGFSQSSVSQTNAGGQSTANMGPTVGNGASSTVSGEPTPLPPEGTGPDGSRTGGGNMPSAGQTSSGFATTPVTVAPSSKSWIQYCLLLGIALRVSSVEAHVTNDG